MGWPKILALVRHAESEGNVLNADQRAEYDVATHRYKLTERGRAQAKITGAWLNMQYGKFDVRYVSYYRRSAETMHIMCPGLKTYEDSRLAEAQRGLWHTMTEKQVRECYPEEFARREKEGLYHYRPWGGQNGPDVELSIYSFLSTLNRDHEGQSVLAVVHGRWLVLFQRVVEHFSIEAALDRFEHNVAENASVTIYMNKRRYGKSRLARTGYVIPWQGKIK